MSLNICLGGKLFLGPQYANGSVTFYDVGTLDLQTTYSDKAGTVPNLATIALDAYGAATVFLTKDAKIVAKTADATEIYTQDGGLIPASTTETGFNLISNGSAEIDSDGDGIPDDWTVSAETGSTNVRVSSDQIHGAYCFKSTDGGSGGGTWLGDPYIPVSGNQPIGYWFELDASHVDVRIVVDVLWYDSSKNQLSGGSAKTNLYDDSATNPTAWARYTGQITPPSGAVYGRFQAALCHSSAASAGKWAEIDNIQLFPSTINQILTTAGDMPYASSAYNAARLALGAEGTRLVSKGGVPAYELPVGYLFSGYTYANNGVAPTTDVDIAVGTCRDSTNTYLIKLAAAITKKFNASWAVGTNQGILDGTEAVAGTPDASTWFYMYSIIRTDTGVVDIIASVNAPAAGPTLPASYDAYRYIGAIYIDSGNLVRAFFQEGNVFRWDVPTTLLSTTTAATSRTALTAITPPGMQALIHCYGGDGSGGRNMLLTRTDQTDTAPSATRNTIGVNVSTGIGDWFIGVDSSSQFYYRCDTASWNRSLYITENGYFDTSRGVV